MPELPEVTTMVRELNVAVRGKIIKNIVTDTPKLVRPLTVEQFRAAVRGQAFLDFERRAKFIVAALGPVRERSSTSYKLHATSYVLWHMGMTGHPLYRNPKSEARNPKLRAAFADPMNQHVRLTFHFTDGTRLEYADIRKFGNIELVRPSDLTQHPRLAKLGPEALDLARRPAALCARLKVRRKAVKVALLDQEVIAGIGNIYADEALWLARIHPLRSTQRLTLAHCGSLARAIRTVLQQAIRAHGTSIDDYRRLFGNKGRYSGFRKAYQRTNLPCLRCGTLMRRMVVGGRGTHVCPRCQRVPSTGNS